MQLRESATSAPDATWISAYLGLLGVGHEQPSLAYLRTLTRCHQLRVPFENITSILRRARTPAGAPVPSIDRAAKLADWQNRRGGGVCFEVADMFSTLLSALGFRAHPVLATISFLGSHQAIVIELDDEQYLVDVGDGAPFFAPLLVSPGSASFELSASGLRYRFRPDADDSRSWSQDRWIEGGWQPFCTYHLEPASESGRQAAYQRHHVRGESWVVDDVRLIRCTESEVWTLFRKQLTHITASGKSVTPVDSVEAHARAVADVFDLPNAPIEEALAATASL